MSGALVVGRGPVEVAGLVGEVAAEGAMVEEIDRPTRSAFPCGRSLSTAICASA